MRRKLITLVLLALCLTVPRAALAAEQVEPAAPPPPYAKVQAGELPCTLSASIVGAQLLIEGVRINGVGPLRFLLDTGAMGGGRVDVSLVERLGLKPVGEVLTGDGSGAPGPSLPRYELASLEIGALRFEGVSVLSRDYNAHASAIRGHIDGVLGFHLFREFLLTLDYPAARVTIEPGELPAPNDRDVLAMDDETVPTIRVTLGGNAYPAHIDSGSMGPVSVGSDVADALTLQAAPAVAAEARTVAGSFPIRLAQLDGDLTVGALTVHQPELAIGPPGRGVNLGSRVLAEFAITFDQAHDRVRFTRDETAVAAQGKKPQKRYGMILAMRGDGPIAVQGVEPDSIAQRAGLSAGDRILQLNGTDVGTLDMVERGAALRASPLALVIERDGAQRTLTLSFD